MSWVILWNCWRYVTSRFNSRNRYRFKTRVRFHFSLLRSQLETKNRNHYDMTKSTTRVALLLLTTSVVLSACAQRTKLVARRNSDLAPTFADPIALSQPSDRDPELDDLGRALSAELARRGAHIVSSAESEYVLACWIEEFEEDTPVGAQVRGVRVPPGSGSVYYRGYSGGMSARADGAYTYNPVITDNIRLRLFISKPDNDNRPVTAWEGSVDGGLRLSPKKYPALLRTLLDHFGTDYIGRVKLV